MKVEGNAIVVYKGKVYEIIGVKDLDDDIAKVFIEKGWVKLHKNKRGRKKKVK